MFKTADIAAKTAVFEMETAVLVFNTGVLVKLTVEIQSQNPLNCG